jgi:hypothetical protein
MSPLVTIYNDGEVAVQYLGKEARIGSIQRSHEINGRTVEQASREKFLADLPVNQEFLDALRDDPESREKIQSDIANALRFRGKVN